MESDLPTEHTATVHERAKIRKKRLVASSAITLVERFTTIVVGLLTVPLALGLLHGERYGIWIATTSLVAGLSFTDLGIGNGLMNAIAEAYGENSTRKAQESVSSGFFVLLSIALGLIALILLGFPHIAWDHLFNVKSALARSEAEPSVAIMFGACVIQMPLYVVVRVQVGYQEVYRASLWSTASLILSFLAMVLAVHLRLGLPEILAAFMLTKAAVILVCFIYEFLFRRPWLIPRWQYVRPDVARRLASVGMVFVTLQIANWFAIWSDNLIVTQILGPEALSSYGILYKLFTAAMLYQYIGNSLWPAFTEAITAGDYQWAHRTFYRGLWLNAATSVAAAAILLFSTDWIMLTWTHDPARVPLQKTIIAFCVWMVVFSFVYVFSSLFNGGKANMKVHAFFFCLAAAVSLPLRIAFAHLDGQAGVANASTIAFGVCYVLPMAYATRLYFKGLLANPASAA